MRRVRLTEGQLHNVIMESVRNILEVYDFASKKPQYDINSDEWKKDYDENDSSSVFDRERNKLSDLQIQQHYFGKKGLNGLDPKIFDWFVYNPKPRQSLKPKAI